MAVADGTGAADCVAAGIGVATGAGVGVGSGAGAGAGAGEAVAVPDRAELTVPAEVATESVALRDPEAAGANETMIVHDADAATVDPAEHVPPVTAKSPLLVPDTVIPPLLIVIEAVPELLKASVDVPAPEPTVREANVALAGLSPGVAAWNVLVEAMSAGMVELPLYTRSGEFPAKVFPVMTADLVAASDTCKAAPALSLKVFPVTVATELSLVGLMRTPDTLEVTVLSVNS